MTESVSYPKLHSIKWKNGGFLAPVPRDIQQAESKCAELQSLISSGDCHSFMAVAVTKDKVMVAYHKAGGVPHAQTFGWLEAMRDRLINDWD